MLSKINFLNQPIGSDDYCLLKILKCSKVEHPFIGALVYHEDEERYYLYSNERNLNGCTPDESMATQLPIKFRFTWRSPRMEESTASKVLKNWVDCQFKSWRIASDEDLEEASSDGFGEFISPNYSKNEIYDDMRGYHSHCYSELNQPIKSFRGHRIGVELEVEFNDEDLKEEFAEVESNWFYKERDGSLNECGVEIITIPLLPKDAKSVEFWQPLTDALNEKANSWDNGRCGLHIHIGREILGSTEDERQLTIGKLLLVYHEFIKDTYFNRKIYGRERGYNDHDGKTTLSSATKELGVRILQDTEVAKKVQKSVIERSSYDRYFDINITPSHTIEFRKGRGSINPHRIAMVVEYSEMLCKYAKQAVWQQLSYENFIHYLKANCKKGTSLYDMVMSYA